MVEQALWALYSVEDPEQQMDAVVSDAVDTEAVGTDVKLSEDSMVEASAAVPDPSEYINGDILELVSPEATEEAVEADGARGSSSERR